MRVSNLISLAAVSILFSASPAFAEAATASATGLANISAGFAIGLAAIGGALGQGRLCAAALEGIGRNPGASGQMFQPLIIGLVLIESLVIYALVIAAKLVGLF